MGVPREILAPTPPRLPVRFALLLLLAATAVSAQPSITPGVFVNATLDQDQQLYRLLADEGDVLELFVQADFDPVLDLRATSGAILATDDDGGEGLWSYVRQVVVPRTGAYTLVVRSYNDAGRGNYSALVRRVGLRGPQACDGNGLSAEDIDAGDRVLLGRHRAVNGSDNWADDMDAYVGRETSVRELSGVDDEGCPVVSVMIDGGDFVWRVRDLAILTGAPLSVQSCGLSLPVDFGAVTVGSEIVLGRHRDVDGEPNWTDDMDPYAWRTTTVTRLVGTDVTGCGIVNVGVDEGSWQWRIRDAMPLMGRFAVPQACGQTDPLDHGPMREGTAVRLGRHRAVDGDANWADDMDAYVGRATTVTALGVADAAGCPTVTVDADGGTFNWRVRDLRVVAPGVGLPQSCETPVSDFGTVAVGTRVRLGEHRPVNGDANWTSEMDGYVGTETRVRSREDIDGTNCTVVKVDADGGEFFWRVRDLTLLE